MSFTDGIYIMVMFAVFILVASTSYYVYMTVYPTIPNVPASVNASITKSVTQNFTFFDTSFAFLFILFSLAAVVMTALVASNPAALMVWLLINFIAFMVYDSLNGFITVFASSSLGSYGIMSTAIAFFQSDVPRLIPVFNMLMAIVLFGKRMFQGGSA